MDVMPTAGESADAYLNHFAPFRSRSPSSEISFTTIGRDGRCILSRRHRNMAESNSGNTACHPTPKRMRLGTRSCTECRRRKVRCIFEANSQICRQCALHGAVCTAQQPGRIHHGISEQDYAAQRRMEKLEAMVRHISSAIGLNVESASVADFETSTAEALKQLPRAPELNGELRTVEINSSLGSVISQSSSINHSLDAGNSFEQAPLLDLFRASMIIEKDSTQPSRVQLETPSDQGTRSCITSLNELLPADDVLFSILQATEMLWPLWQPFPERVFKTPVGNCSCQVTLAKNFILESFRAGSPVAVARAVLCLTLCIQQLPAKFHHLKSLPYSANILIDFYLCGVETLLMSEVSTRSLEGVECWPLLAKLYVNIGKPRKAWLSCRRGMDFALILGLNRKSGQANEREQIIWASIWQMEAHTALITGVPCGIAQTYPRLPDGYIGQSVSQRVMYKIATACGHINERNQDPQNSRFSTSQIEEELLQCRNDMPSEWWDYHSNNLSIHMLFSSLAAKLPYLELVKDLHLPFMLAPCAFGDHQRSKAAGLTAAREMVEAYLFFRHACGTSFIVCDLLDFIVFTGAVLIIINLLQQSSSVTSNEDTSDWKLVSDVSEAMDLVSREMECSVAGQASQLLQYLCSSCRGTYSGPEAYEAVIPYFGKVRIRQTKRSPNSNLTSVSTPNSLPTTPCLNSLEFSVGQFPSGDTMLDAELGIDWTSVLDTDNTAYDWNYVFDNIGCS